MKYKTYYDSSESDPNVLIAELRSELNAMRRKLAEAEKSRDYARQLAADASIKFAETAAKLELAERNLRLANSLLAEVEPFIGWTGKPDGMSERVAEYLAAIAAGEGSRD